MAGFVLDEVYGRDERVTRVFKIGGADSEVTYYRNRLTMEESRASAARSDDDEGDDEEDDESQSNAVAARLCRILHEWDWEGPLYNGAGEMVVARGETVPFDPEIIKLIPLRATKALNEAIIEAELGNGSKKRRR